MLLSTQLPESVDNPGRFNPRLLLPTSCRRTASGVTRECKRKRCTSAEPIPVGCEHIVDSGLGLSISMEK